MNCSSTTNLFNGLEPGLCALLRSLNVHRVPHSKRTLAHHLLGTYELLCAWGNDEAVCRGGLFHSIYGTRVFAIQCADFSSRKMVRDVIGTRAEFLAYLFCIADRKTFFAAAKKAPHFIHDAVANVDLQVSRHVLSSLLEIEAANIVEHLPRRGRETRRDMGWYRNAFTGCRNFLSAGATVAILGALDACTADKAVDAISKV